MWWACVPGGAGGQQPGGHAQCLQVTPANGGEAVRDPESSAPPTFNTNMGWKRL